MRELLERWAELEPERYDIYKPGTSRSAWVRFSAREHRIGLNETDPRQQLRLLAAVIEAIEARGGSWELRGSGCPASARVTLNGAAQGCIADEPTDPPAF